MSPYCFHSSLRTSLVAGDEKVERFIKFTLLSARQWAHHHMVSFYIFQVKPYSHSYYNPMLRKGFLRYIVFAYSLIICTENHIIFTLVVVRNVLTTFTRLSSFSLVPISIFLWVNQLSDRIQGRVVVDHCTQNLVTFRSA